MQVSGAGWRCFVCDTDLAEVSVEQARDRWNSMNARNKFHAEFYAMDCYEVTTPLVWHHPAPDLSR